MIIGAIIRGSTEKSELQARVFIIVVSITSETTLFYFVLFVLNITFSDCQSWHYTLLGLQAVICEFRHVLREDGKRPCAHGTRTDVEPPSFSSSTTATSLSWLPRRHDWREAVQAANQRALRVICIKWPHAIGLVRAAANRFACRYRRLLLLGGQEEF